MITETVYLGRDNAIDLLLKAEGMSQDLSSVSRMVLADRGDAFVVDSDLSPGAIDWNTGTIGKIHLSLGQESLPIGVHVCDLIVYDPTNSDGIHWGRIVLKVV